jgi:NTP pyrophosphatase (non-canonical NTP hydrolase)
MKENSRNRTKVDPAYFKQAMRQINTMRELRTIEKGDGTFASQHEILGIVTEEYYEYIKAVQENDFIEAKKELIDIAVACVFGIACIDAATVDW